jgi:hypothetical protein
MGSKVRTMASSSHPFNFIALLFVALLLLNPDPSQVHSDVKAEDAADPL